MKPKMCTKGEAVEDLKEKIWEDEAIVTFHLWKDNTVWIEMEQHWDPDLTADFFVDWFRHWCISSLFELGKSLLTWGDNDMQLKYHFIEDFLNQLKIVTEKEFWKLDVKKETSNNSVAEDKDSAVEKFNKLLRWYYNKD